MTVCIMGVLDAGPDSLAPAARRRLGLADLVIGDDRFLDLYSPLMAVNVEKRSFTGELTRVPLWLEEARNQGRQVVVLATGDPLFFGLAGHLAKKLPPGSFEVECQVSSLQQAFARVSLAWSEARWLSLHARESGDWDSLADFDHALYPLWRALGSEKIIGILTSPANTPGRIARMLVSLKLEQYWKMTVCQRLGSIDETIARDVDLYEGVHAPFLEPNVVILRKIGTVKKLPVFGLPDDFYHKKKFKKGLMTRRDVRVLALAHLAITDGDIVWDIGAGSGSVGLEAAGLTPDGQVWSIEKNAESVHHVLANRTKLGRFNYRIHSGVAPAGLETWPDPDAVFIGGSGGNLEQLLAIALARLKRGGRLVINLVTLENLSRTLTCLSQHRQPWEMTQTGCAISQPLLDMNRLESQSPVWIITTTKERDIL